MDDVVSRQTVKRQMIEYGFHAPDMTVTEFVEDLSSVNSQKSKTEPRYCDRNICLRNEYNSIGCNECEVTKSQESNTVIGTGDGAYYRIKALQAQADGDLVSRLSVIGKIEAEAWSYCEGLDANKQIYISEAINNIREAVKQLPSVDIPPAEPREVLYSGDGYADGEMVYDMAECMNCGREFEYDDETWGCNFCPDCGQALKWEGEQE